jgi:hypothetical protein
MTHPGESGPAGPGERGDEVDALKLEYDYVRAENLRLRDGRATITSRLGPLPIGAAVVAGLVTGFTTETRENVWLWLALAVFFALVIVSILYSSMKPYRVIRHEKETKGAVPARSKSSPREWYKAAIALEEEIYGKPNSDTGIRRHLPAAEINGLQDGYDRERSGLFIVQFLFAVVIVLLIVSRIL